MGALITSFLFVVCVSSFIAVLSVFLLTDESEQEDVGKRPGDGQASKQGGGDMFKKRGDVFAEFVKQINQVRDELGLPRLPIETIHDGFGKMSKELLTKLELHTGPVFKENVAGWVSLVLELIGKHNEDLGRLSIEENRWAIGHIKLRDAGKFTTKNLDTALDSVDELVAVLAQHGEEKAEDVGRFLRRRITYQILLGDYLPKLPGAQKDPELVEAVIKEIIPLLPGHDVESQDEGVVVEVVEGQVEEVSFGSNGDRPREKEYGR